jgi:hypothetical protein
MSRDELMHEFIRTRVLSHQPPNLARSARQATYQTCRTCGTMLIQAHKGGLECAAGCRSSGLDFSGQSSLVDTDR